MIAFFKSIKPIIATILMVLLIVDLITFFSNSSMLNTILEKDDTFFVFYHGILNINGKRYDLYKNKEFEEMYYLSGIASVNNNSAFVVGSKAHTTTSTTIVIYEFSLDNQSFTELYSGDFNISSLNLDGNIFSCNSIHTYQRHYGVYSDEKELVVFDNSKCVCYNYCLKKIDVFQNKLYEEKIKLIQDSSRDYSITSKEIISLLTNREDYSTLLDRNNKKTISNKNMLNEGEFVIDYYIINGNYYCICEMNDYFDHAYALVFEINKDKDSIRLINYEMVGWIGITTTLTKQYSSE